MIETRDAHVELVIAPFPSFFPRKNTREKPRGTKETVNKLCTQGT